jgi:hypothetical protein
VRLRGSRASVGSPGRRWVIVVALATVTALAVVAGAVALAARPGTTHHAQPEAAPAAESASGAGESPTEAPAGSVSPTSSTSSVSSPATPPSGAGAEPPNHQSSATSPKKGVSTWEFSGLATALRDVGVSWYWNWAPHPTPGAGDSVEFVPMIWGAGAVTAETLDRARRSGTVLLGFNEPDLASQSNMSVEQALDLWPQLQATGMRLGSPAPAFGGADPGGWLDRFLTGAAQRGYRVDFIALHWYGSDFSPAAVGHLRAYLQAVWERYHLPIWLTEFALIRWEPSGAVYPTGAEQAAFIQGATRMLEDLSFVERYAWFALPAYEQHGGTGLYREGAVPTAAGLAYRQAGA